MRYIERSKGRVKETDLALMSPVKGFRDAENFLKYVASKFVWGEEEDEFRSDYGISVSPVSSDVYLSSVDVDGHLNPEVLDDLKSILVTGRDKRGEITGSVYIAPEDIKMIAISKHMLRFESKRGTVVDIIGTAR